MATDRPRYTVSVDAKMFQQIEDFRFENRFQTRSEATVELIRLGLEALEKERAAGRRKNHPLKSRKGVCGTFPEPLLKRGGSFLERCFSGVVLLPLSQRRSSGKNERCGSLFANGGLSRPPCPLLS